MWLTRAVGLHVVYEVVLTFRIGNPFHHRRSAAFKSATAGGRKGPDSCLPSAWQVECLPVRMSPKGGRRSSTTGIRRCENSSSALNGGEFQTDLHMVWIGRSVTEVTSSGGSACCPKSSEDSAWRNGLRADPACLHLVPRQLSRLSERGCSRRFQEFP